MSWSLSLARCPHALCPASLCSFSCAIVRDPWFHSIHSMPCSFSAGCLHLQQSPMGAPTGLAMRFHSEPSVELMHANVPPGLAFGNNQPMAHNVYFLSRLRTALDSTHVAEGRGDDGQCWRPSSSQSSSSCGPWPLLGPPAGFAMMI